MAEKNGAGQRRGSVVLENGEPKLGYVVVAGVEYKVNPTYQIRRYRDGKAYYDSVGSDYEAALEKLDKYYLSRQRDELDRKLGIHKPTEQANPDTPGAGFGWDGFVASASTVTVRLCAIAAGTPTSTAYNVRVIQ